MFSYDGDGNMTMGLGGKVMIYDGENRPLTVTAQNGDQTVYVYGADGARLKRIKAVFGQMATTLFVGGVEVVQALNEPDQVHWDPHSKGHVSATTWDQACQVPDKVTDINTLVTDYTYDAHCREDYVALPGSNYVDMQYQSLGGATAKYIR